MTDFLIETLEDGTVIKTKPIGWGLRQKPTYGAWLSFLLSRDAARQYTDGWRITKDGERVPQVKVESLSDQIARIDDETGLTYIVCIRCGTPCTTAQATLQKRFTGGKTADQFTRQRVQFIKDLGRICVGGFVRMPVEEQVGPKEFLRHTVLRPVSKQGVGCTICQGLYAVEVAKAAVENHKRERLGKAMRELWMIEDACGLKPALIKAPQPITAWIDVFEDYGKKIRAEVVV